MRIVSRHGLLVTMLSLFPMGCKSRTETQPHKPPGDAVVSKEPSEKEQKAPTDGSDEAAPTRPTGAATKDVYVQDDPSLELSDSREEYVRAVVNNFWRHDRWRKTRLIQSLIGSEVADQGQGRARFGLERAVGLDPPGPAILHLDGSFSVVLHHVADFPWLEEKIEKEALDALTGIFSDMEVISGDLRGKAREGTVIVRDGRARLETREGSVEFETRWSEPPYGQHTGARKLTVELRAVVEPLVARTKEWQETRLLRGLRWFRGIEEREEEVIEGKYDPRPGLASENPDVRIKNALVLWEAVWRCYKLGPACAEALIEAIKNEEDTLVLPFLFLPFEMTLEADMAERLVTLVETGDEQVAALAARALVRTRSELALWDSRNRTKLGRKAIGRMRQAAIEALATPERTRAASVLRHCGVDGDDEAIRALVKAIREEPHPHCVHQLFFPFIFSQGMQVFDAMVSLLDDDRPEVWGEAARWLPCKRKWQDAWRARREKLEGDVRLRAFLIGHSRAGFEEELKRSPEEAEDFLVSLISTETRRRSGLVFSEACRHLAVHDRERALPLLVRSLRDLKAAGELTRPGSMPAPILYEINGLTGHDYGGLRGKRGSLEWSKAAKAIDWDAVFEELRRDFPPGSRAATPQTAIESE